MKMVKDKAGFVMKSKNHVELKVKQLNELCRSLAQGADYARHNENWDDFTMNMKELNKTIAQVGALNWVLGKGWT